MSNERMEDVPKVEGLRDGPRFREHGFRPIVLRPVPGFCSRGRVEPPPVIVALDVCGQIASGILAGRPSPLVDEFDLECVKEAFMGALSQQQAEWLIDGLTSIDRAWVDDLLEHRGKHVAAPGRDRPRDRPSWDPAFHADRKARTCHYGTSGKLSRARCAVRRRRQPPLQCLFI